jgi:hypothetical protein
MLSTLDLLIKYYFSKSLRMHIVSFHFFANLISFFSLHDFEHKHRSNPTEKYRIIFDF